jgi:ankyrin repeat protein
MQLPVLFKYCQSKQTGKDTDMRAILIYALLFLIVGCAGFQKSMRDNALWSAVQHQNEDLVAIDIKAGSDPNFIGPYEVPVLVEACAIDQASVTIVLKLLEAGADINTQTKNGDTCLHWALRKRHTALIKVLVDSGASVDIDNSYGTALEMAIYMSASVELVNILLDADSYPVSSPNQRDSILNYSIGLNRIAIANSLLDRGARHDYQNSYGTSPLHMAALVGSLDLVKRLLDAGAEVDITDINGSTPLLKASAQGHYYVAKYLLDHGARHDYQNRNGISPLHLAAQVGSLDLVKRLLGAGAEVDITAIYGSTPLLEASTKGHYYVAKYLLAQGADPRRVMSTGESMYELMTEGPVKRLMVDAARKLDALDASKVIAKRERNRVPKPKKQSFSGSAWKVAPRIYVTNFHVIDGAQKVAIGNPREQSWLPVKVLVADEHNDLAILESDEDLGGLPMMLRKIPVGTGEKVYVMGFPLGAMLGREVKITDGIISSRTGTNDSPGEFQTTAAINSGNSGGPIVDQTGAVVGVATAKIVGEHLDNLGIGVKSTTLINSIEVANLHVTLAPEDMNMLSGKELYLKLNDSVFQVISIVE